MPTDGGDTVRRAALVGALDEAIAGLPGEDPAASRDAPDERWLGTGLRLGRERPEQARRRLKMIAPTDAADAVLPGDDTEGIPAPIPVPSSLLARAAALSPSERARMGPDVTFGWAVRLTSGEILSLGRVVGDMLASGSPPDIVRGFGLTWDAGVRLPRQDLDAMFREFTELEITVGCTLAGRDLRADGQAPRSRGLGTMFDLLVNRPRPGESQAAAALENSGEPGRRGLVALWNVWVAMCYRSLIPGPTFDLLARPWVTVVGPLPAP